MISEENEMQLCFELRRDEGIRYSPYKDSRGFLTVGVGHLIASPMPSGWTFPLDDVEVDALLESDLMSAYADLDRALPWWSEMNDVRQRVICNMIFNLGLTKLLGFKNTLAAMRQGRYADAALDMLNSAWAQQVGARAIRLAYMMKTGETQ